MAQSEEIQKSAGSSLNVDIEKDAPPPAQPSPAQAPAPPAGPPPPPNGGLQAWLQVLGAFFFVLNTWYVGMPVALRQGQGPRGGEEGMKRIIPD